jgi:hypothetical protein
MQALDPSSAERVYALPQLIPQPIEGPIPESIVYDRKAAGVSLPSCARVLWYAWRWSKAGNLVIDSKVDGSREALLDGDDGDYCRRNGRVRAKLR